MDPAHDVALFIHSTPDSEGRWFSRYPEQLIDGFPLSFICARQRVVQADSGNGAHLAKAWGRELGPHRGAREKGQIKKPSDQWITREVPELRIITPDLAARVDARRTAWRQQQKTTAARSSSGARTAQKHSRCRHVAVPLKHWRIVPASREACMCAAPVAASRVCARTP